MYYDLNVPVPSLNQSSGSNTSKKAKQKTPGPDPAYNATQISVVEARIDLLVRLGYTVFAFNQFVLKRVDQKSHVNTAKALVSQLKKRTGIVYLKRLSIILDDDSEKGFGLTNANASLFTSYDLISLVPLTQATFSLACLTHSMPSPLTAHIISLPLTLPRLPFYLKHTLIRTAIKNGAVFEISYVGAIGGENYPFLVDAGGAENGPGAKRNWWAAGKELARVSKGKNLLISGGVMSDADLRAPKDIGNLCVLSYRSIICSAHFKVVSITLLGLAQDVSHSSLTQVPKSLLLRAQTRSTYRAVLSEPKVVFLEERTDFSSPSSINESNTVSTEPQTTITSSKSMAMVQTSTPRASQPLPKKRPREGMPEADTAVPTDGSSATQKKRRKKDQGQVQG
ncbi:Ribonuclease P protein subunit p30 [Termitomyces sp. J132]|nr:Ribonuclease P protein subunit p30 [Termitomyces sp. J132]